MNKVKALLIFVVIISNIGCEDSKESKNKNEQAKATSDVQKYCTKGNNHSDWHCQNAQKELRISELKNTKVSFQEIVNYDCSKSRDTTNCKNTQKLVKEKCLEMENDSSLFAFKSYCDGVTDSFVWLNYAED